MRRHQLRRRELEALLNSLQPAIRRILSTELTDESALEVLSTRETTVYLLRGVPAIASTTEGESFPTLKWTGAIEALPRVVVDMGAVPKICNGANIMAPGVVRVEGEFAEKAHIAIVDVRNLKPIAVGLSLMTSMELASTRQGKVVKNLHHVGDALWRLSESLP
ncbi:MAG: PUA domain-containing protein [Candidatus Bathyarchaeia archaeon]